MVCIISTVEDTLCSRSSFSTASTLPPIIIFLFHSHSYPLHLANFPTRHVVSGLVATFIEDPLAVQKQLSNNPLPPSHTEACKISNTPMQGNAAGNTKNYLDLSGENKSPGRIPAGFTARGIVALVFSVVAAFVGCAVIGWYGMLPIKAGV